MHFLLNLIILFETKIINTNLARHQMYVVSNVIQSDYGGLKSYNEFQLSIYNLYNFKLLLFFSLFIFHLILLKYKNKLVICIFDYRNNFYQIILNLLK